MPDAHPIFAEIAALLDERSKAGLPELEYTLTAGYAAALQLEADRWRIERRISHVASQIDVGGHSRTRELSRLARRLKSADDELARLRAILRALRERALAARAVA
jgi:hypothetical protein